MTSYLVVAYQTATSPELAERVSELVSDDPEASFTLLVPATPVDHFLVWEEGETHQIAHKRAEEARVLLEGLGAKVAGIEVGDSSPLLAIEDELRTHPQEYDAIILSTFPPGVSRWLRLDVHNQAERKFNIPLIHVVAEKR